MSTVLRFAKTSDIGLFLMVVGALNIGIVMVVWDEIFALKGASVQPTTYAWPNLNPLCYTSTSCYIIPIDTVTSWYVALAWFTGSVAVLLLGLILYYRRRIRHPRLG